MLLPRGMSRLQRPVLEPFLDNHPLNLALTTRVHEICLAEQKNARKFTQPSLAFPALYKGPPQPLESLPLPSQNAPLQVICVFTSENSFPACTPREGAVI